MQTKDRTILIVEDDKEFCDYYKDILIRQGYNIEIAMELQKADSMLRSLNPDIVILDLRFPHDPEEGLDFLKKIIAYNQIIKVIVATGARDRNVALKAIELGAYDFIDKETSSYTELPFRVNQAYERLQLERELNEFRKSEIERIGGYPYGDGKVIIGTSERMREVYNDIDKFAPTNLPILIYGETGTGKELVAEAIQAKSRRANKPFICKSILDIPREGSLLELELFGRVANYPNRGDVALPGLFEKAHEGTLFLDEIAGVPLGVQERLLRVLRQKVVVRMGDKDERNIQVDCRLIMATNKELQQEFQKGLLREDMLYRLERGGIIRLPPLRERITDISQFANYFLYKHRESNPSIEIQENAISLLKAYSWPGNVAELESTIERAMIIASGNFISAEDVEKAMGKKFEKGDTSLPSLLHHYEGGLILDALLNCDWNQSEAAKKLGIPEGTLRYKMRKLEIKKEA